MRIVSVIPFAVLSFFFVQFAKTELKIPVYSLHLFARPFVAQDANDFGCEQDALESCT